MKAGSGVPVKFSLAGDQGARRPRGGLPDGRVRTACSPSAPVDAIEQTAAAGASGLSYDAETDVYTYVWKTQKSWAGKCATFSLQLSDGTTHTALFSFTK